MACGRAVRHLCRSDHGHIHSCAAAASGVAVLSGAAIRFSSTLDCGRCQVHRCPRYALIHDSEALIARACVRRATPREGTCAAMKIDTKLRGVGDTCEDGRRLRYVSMAMIQSVHIHPIVQQVCGHSPPGAIYIYMTYTCLEARLSASRTHARAWLSPNGHSLPVSLHISSGIKLFLSSSDRGPSRPACLPKNV